ncbi:DUF4112 domain-containing protein [Candidatus Gottesmanbacteria bacterium]|nr:DUF4112 domain-containing protein [Candidatus Gottesmanbacteria bacterium]
MNRTAVLASHIDFARRLTRVMDLRFNVFGVRFGIDPLLNIIPGMGNIVAAATSLYLMWIAFQLKVPTAIYMKMLWNIAVDYIFGVVPVIGIVFDVFYRANVKNFKLLETYFTPDIVIGEVVDGE